MYRYVYVRVYVYVYMHVCMNMHFLILFIEFDRIVRVLIQWVRNNEAHGMVQSYDTCIKVRRAVVPRHCMLHISMLVYILVKEFFLVVFISLFTSYSY